MMVTVSVKINHFTISVFHQDSKSSVIKTWHFDFHIKINNLGLWLSWNLRKINNVTYYKQITPVVSPSSIMFLYFSVKWFIPIAIMLLDHHRLDLWAILVWSFKQLSGSLCLFLTKVEDWPLTWHMMYWWTQKSRG